ncbi:hypothetical protein LOTGIDRAFT_203561 [Lottia gigantea]|uniref:Uncharacterized protein n=1 Tax=Lottia gigantea TaxID=225164 RepID=V4B2H1_LOTGI|nr:hypothetical protein LOTGIDRAFT_203561 [Lottia gigantea]ESP00582.1 hypothetical protein LOTGIDRAFT_203561 [Lottia gigantea]
MSGWQHSIFGCFDNLGVCIITYFVPCYTFARTSEQVGESCLLCGILYFIPLVDIFAVVSVRGKVREHKGIGGSCLEDLLYHVFCHPCALVQEAQEMQHGPMSAYGMARE